MIPLTKHFKNLQILRIRINENKKRQIKCTKIRKSHKIITKSQRSPNRYPHIAKVTPSEFLYLNIGFKITFLAIYD